MFGLSGALLAIRRGFDVVGIVVLAGLTALGGGLLRDVVVGDIPPAAFVDARYLAVPAAAAAVAFFAHGPLGRVFKAVLVFDAAGLALFTVTGTLKALAFGLGPLQSALLGVTSAVGGGLLRDVVARETPALVRADSTLYAVPAAAGAAVLVVTDAAGASAAWIGVTTAIGILVVRVAALRFGWRAPRAWRSTA